MLSKKKQKQNKTLEKYSFWGEAEPESRAGQLLPSPEDQCLSLFGLL